MMLGSAIKYRRAFTNLSYNDKHYKICPSNEEWERAEKMCAFQAPFYTIINLISGSYYPTSNLYFMQVAVIEMELNESLNSKDGVIKDMAKRMKLKFDKYWSEYSVTLALGCVLDPTSKLDILNFCFKRLYPIDYQEKVNRIKDGLYELFDEYTNNMVASSSSIASSSRDTQSHSFSHPLGKSSFLEAYSQEKRQKASNDDEPQLEIYLNEACFDGNDVDILQY